MITWSNLFGTIANGSLLYGTTKQFIPIDGKGGTIDVKGTDAQWLGLQTPQMQYWAYLYCAPLAAVIDRLSEADINGCFEVVKADKTEDISNSKNARLLRKLFANPNQTQTFAEWRGQQVVLKKVFGYCPVWNLKPAGFEKQEALSLWNLNPYYCRPVFNDTFDIYKQGQSVIKEWNVTIFNKTFVIPPEQVFVLRDGYTDSLRTADYMPLSKIAGLDWAVSNILAAMEADNVLLKKRGPLGFISNDGGRDSFAGGIIAPLEKPDKEELQANLQNYGMSWDQFQYVISRFPVKWNPMSFNLKDLMTKETARQGIDMICDRFGYPAELMSGKNATYENRTSAEKFLYQNNVIPSNMRDMSVFNNYFDTVELGVNLSMDYDELPVLQENLLQEGQSNKFNTDAWLVQFHERLIHLNQYRTLCGHETIPDQDVYYNSDEYLKIYPNAAVAPENKGTQGKA